MNEPQNDLSAYNRRDFLKGGSVAALMSMLGGVELLAQNNNAAPVKKDAPSATIKVAVIGLGAWGRKIVDQLHLIDEAVLAGLCDAYEPALNRVAKDFKGMPANKDYKTLLADPEVRAVVIAVPTHLHKEIALASLKAGKHVYCEAPLAHTIDDARAIAQAAKATPTSVFQAGLQGRADDGRHYVLSSLRSGVIGRALMARAQWHKKNSWRVAAANPERETALNWRLDKDLSLGLIGEAGIHQLDQTNWFLNALPTAITGFGGLLFHKDGRQLPDTLQAIFEYPGGIHFTYDATLASSFDSAYEVIFGSDATVMFRENRQWLFKEVDSVLLPWEIYATKEKFYHETGIVLSANATKSAVKPKAGEGEAKPEEVLLASALNVFVHNAIDVDTTLKDVREALKDDPAAINDMAGAVKRKPAAGYLEGFQATVVAAKANEAVLSGKRVELKPDLFELS